MFTGIVTDQGTILNLHQEGDLRARIATTYDVGHIDIGASIACDGVCLTVVALGQSHEGSIHGWFDVQISAETVGATTLSGWHLGQVLNLERALRLGDELGGHIVSGHVDGVAQVIASKSEGDSLRVTFDAPKALAKFIAPKGSVSLNGTSLTVNEVSGVSFGVNLIAHTRAVTNWGRVKRGDLVNLEIDTVARYVSRLREWD